MKAATLIVFITFLIHSALCGRRIINGHPVPIEKYPYAVVVFDERTSVCAGFALTPKWVLTLSICDAAHVLYGQTDVGAEIDDLVNNNNTINVARIVKRPSVSGFLAPVLLELESPIPDFPISSRPKLPLSTWEVPESATNPLLIIGWGLTENGTSLSVLREGAMQIIGNEECVKAFQDLEEVIEYALCGANANNQNVCFGDSGGPAILDDVVVGMAAWFPFHTHEDPCGQEDAPTGFFNLAKFVADIEKITGLKQDDEGRFVEEVGSD